MPRLRTATGVSAAILVLANILAIALVLWRDENNTQVASVGRKSGPDAGDVKGASKPLDPDLVMGTSWLKHSGLVTSVAFSRDGALLVSRSDYEIRVWGITGRAVLHERSASADGSFWTGSPYPRIVAFCPDGSSVAYTGDRDVRLWRTGLGEEPRRLGIFEPYQEYTSLCCDNKGAVLAMGSVKGTIRLWSLARQRESARLEGHGARVASLAFSPNDEILVSGADNGSIRLWDVGAAAEHAAVEHPQGVRSLAFSPDGSTFASGGSDGTVRIWDASGGGDFRMLDGHTGAVSVAFCRQGQVLSCGDESGLIRFFRTSDWKLANRVLAHKTGVETLAASPDGEVLASSAAGIYSEPLSEGAGVTVYWSTRRGTEMLVRFWHVATGRELTAHRGHEAPVKDIGFSPDGSALASASSDNTVRIWDTGTGAELAQYAGHNAEVYCVSFSNSGKIVASGDRSGRICVWGRHADKEVLKLDGHDRSVVALAFSPGDETMASASYDKTVRLWSLTTGKETGLLRHPDSITSVLFSDNGEVVASGCRDGAIRLWDVTSQEEVSRFEVRGYPNELFNVKKDGRVSASIRDLGGPAVWDSRNGLRALRLTSSGRRAWRTIDPGATLQDNSYYRDRWVFEPDAVAFSSSTGILATGHSDGIIRLWRVGKDEPLALLGGDKVGTSCLVFAQDGTRIAAAGRRCVVGLWNLPAGLPGTPPARTQPRIGRWASSAAR